jgi:hypothetical protein
MAHFAQIDNNNKVVQVIVIDNDKTHDENGLESEALGVAYCKELFGSDTQWLQTSYNANDRGVFAGVGMTYDVKNDKFIPDDTASFVVIEEPQTAIE